MSLSELAPILGKPSAGAVGVFLCECREKLKNNTEFKECCEKCGYSPKD